MQNVMMQKMIEMNKKQCGLRISHIRTCVKGDVAQMTVIITK